MNIDLVVLLFSGVAIALLGLTIYLRNPAELANKRFAVLSLSMLSWVTFNYLSDYANAHDLFFTRMAFVGGILTAWWLMLFVSDFPVKSVLSYRILLRAHSIMSLLMVACALTPYIVASVGEESLQTGLLYPLFIVYIFFSLLLVGILPYQQFRKADNPTVKRQALILAGSILVYGTLTTASNVIIPIIVDNWTLSRLGPVFSLIFVAAVAYAIIKHRLFDIRPIVARTIAYALLIITLGAGLFAVIFVVINRMMHEDLSSVAVVIYIVAALVVAFCLQPLKRVFDRFTNRFFYQDAYDSQELFNKFNQSLVGAVDVDTLLQVSTLLIASSLKSDFCVVGLEETHSLRIRTVGTGNKTFAKEDLVHGRHLLRNFKEFPVVVDYLSPDHHELKILLERNGIAVLVPLIEHPDQELGYLILGAKKSGTPYTDQDIKVISTLSGELSIAMQNALRFEQIEQFNATLQEKIDDATRKLRRTNDKLRKLDETKDDFISMASHQLRTPLTSVKGYVSMVLDGDAGKITPLQRKLLTQSFISSQRMVYLISDLLNVSRLKTGKFLIEPVPTNLAEIIDEEVEQLLETAKGRNLTLHFNKPEHFPTLMLDETKIRQVLMNFIDNAVYYTPSGGHITINLVDRPKVIEFTVVDDGIGVPRHEQHHLFTKFFRAHNAKRARPDGTGLGLFMAKKVIIAQGGAVIFKSQEGRGSTFGFTFAKDRLVPPPQKQ